MVGNCEISVHIILTKHSKKRLTNFTCLIVIKLIGREEMNGMCVQGVYIFLYCTSLDMSRVVHI